MVQNLIFKRGNIGPEPNFTAHTHTHTYIYIYIHTFCRVKTWSKIWVFESKLGLRLGQTLVQDFLGLFPPVL